MGGSREKEGGGGRREGHMPTYAAHVLTHMFTYDNTCWDIPAYA